MENKLSSNITHLEVRAEPRYWEDATVNGEEDTDGVLIPFRKGEMWCPLIRLEDGFIENWPTGTTANVHYKVCDQGEYWLVDSKENRLLKYKGDYVPDDFLCVDDNGYGDYIIFNVEANGFIKNWKFPVFDLDLWRTV